MCPFKVEDRHIMDEDSVFANSVDVIVLNFDVVDGLILLGIDDALDLDDAVQTLEFFSWEEFAGGDEFLTIERIEWVEGGSPYGRELRCALRQKGRGRRQEWRFAWKGLARGASGCQAGALRTLGISEGLGCWEELGFLLFGLAVLGAEFC